MTKNDWVSYNITRSFVVKGRKRVIRLGEVVDFASGNTSSDDLRLATTCFVKKLGSSNYQLLNMTDHRISNAIKGLRSSTKIEVVEVEAKDAEEVSYITGKVIPQQTSHIKFKAFIDELVSNPEYQQFIASFITTQSVRSNSNLLFNQVEFMDTLGANSPSKASIRNFIKNTDKAPKVTPPTQSFPSHDNNTSLRSPLSQEIKKNTTKQSNKNAELASHERIDFEGQLKGKWNSHSSSKFNYDEVRDKLSTDEQHDRFTERLKTFNPDAPEFSEFVKKLEEFLDGE